MPMISLIHSTEKEGAYDKSQKMLLVWAVWKSILPWIHSKNNRIIEEHIIANFPLDSRAKKVKLTTKQT